MTPLCLCPVLLLCIYVYAYACIHVCV
jgi:hypothetical protein